jgi:hypothetical protein
MVARTRRVEVDYGGTKYRYDPDTNSFKTLANVDVDVNLQRQMLNDSGVSRQLLSQLDAADFRRLSSGATDARVRAPTPVSFIDRIRNTVGLNFRVKGDNIAVNPVSRTTVDAGKVKPEVTNAKQAKQATQADAEKAVNESVPNTPEGTKLKADADDLAKDPNVAKTLQKWGIRGGVGVIFLMLIYDTANPFEAIGKGAKDAKKGAEGAGDIFSSLFEAFKGILEFLKNNAVVSVSSSICCVLLIMLPMLMQGARRIAPRPYYGGQY